jgi:hypothetical protein
MNYIPLEECKHGYLYRLSSRNLSFGVFDQTTKGFVGIRQKFEIRYLFTEYHWDTGEPFGTAYPLGLLDECPIQDLAEGFSVDEDGQRFWKIHQELFDWLDEKKEEHS